MDGRNNLQLGCSPDDTRGKTQNTGKTRMKGPGRARTNRACPGCVLVKRLGAGGTREGMSESRMRLDSRAQKLRRSSGSGAGAQAGSPLSSRRPAVPALHCPAPLTCGPRAAATGRKCQPRSSLPVRPSRPSPTHFRGRSRPPGGFSLGGV